MTYIQFLLVNLVFNLHVEFIFILAKMKMLFFMLLFFIVLNKNDNDHSYLLIFTGQGTFYKLNLENKYVEWYSALDSSLLDFSIVDKNSQKIPSYILPTLDGHFLYIDAQSQILIDRKQVEQLLNICFENQQRKKQGGSFLQYFIYQKYEYYIINLNNGDVDDIQKILKNGVIPKLDRMAILKVSKKYLKQIKSDYSIIWSALSSQIDLVPASLFLKNSQTQSSSNKQNDDINFQLRRLANNRIEFVQGDQSFQIGGKGHIISIFSTKGPQKGFLKHDMKYIKRQTLALQDKSYKAFQLKPVDVLNNQQKLFYIHSEQLKEGSSKLKGNDLQICINRFRNLKALTDQSLKGYINKNIPYRKIDKQDHYSLTVKYNNRQYCNTSNVNGITYGPTKDQPYVWIAIVIGILIISISFIVFKIKMKNIMKELSHRQNQTDKRLLQFENKLGKFQQLKKMYQVHWDKIIYKVAGDKWYEHIVFQGKFLNQEAIVYAVRQEGTDIISIEYKLNILLNFSHKGVAKLYYYTKNSQFLLIFTQKISPLSLKDYNQYFSLQMTYHMKKNIIAQLIQATAYLDNKIQIFELPHEAIDLNIKKDEAQRSIQYKIKINSVPCLLRKYFPQDTSFQDTKSQSHSFSLDNSTHQLRMNLVGLSHLILHKGELFDKAKIDVLLKDQAYSQDQYLQFYDFIIYEVKSRSQSTQKDIQGGPLQNLRELMFKEILDHPFLWDSKRKILFLSDFSNYIQTHIDETKGKKLQLHARNYNIIKIPWSRQFHFLFARQLNSYRKYDNESVRDLIRVIRNKLNHFHEISKQTREHIGVTPQGFVEYCLGLFPKLLHFAFVYARKKKWKLHMK